MGDHGGPLTAPPPAVTAESDPSEPTQMTGKEHLGHTHEGMTPPNPRLLSDPSIAVRRGLDGPGREVAVAEPT